MLATSEPQLSTDFLLMGCLQKSTYRRMSIFYVVFLQGLGLYSKLSGALVGGGSAPKRSPGRCCVAVPDAAAGEVSECGRKSRPVQCRVV